MTSRERFVQTMTFGSPDRPAAADYFAYASTRERWESEGLPKGADLDEYFGMDFDPFEWQVPADLTVKPNFGYEELESTDRYVIARRPTGDIVKIIHDLPPPAMPMWLKHPIESKDEWKEHKRRLDPDTPERLPPDFAEQVKRLNEQDRPVGMWLGGAYGVIRDWWGLEALAYLLYDDQALVQEMIEHLTHLSAGMLERVLSYGLKLDWVMFYEDMAYKSGLLISPELFRKLCLPFYRTVMEKVHAAGVPVVLWDSDGKIDEIIPVMLDVGINVLHPMEVACGMDVIEARKKYGRRAGFFGGIDKRALIGTREQIDREVIPKLDCCFEDGGFMPACDHGIPPDVSFDNYCYFRELVRRVAGGRCGS